MLFVYKQATAAYHSLANSRIKYRSKPMRRRSIQSHHKTRTHRVPRPPCRPHLACPLHPRPPRGRVARPQAPVAPGGAGPSGVVQPPGNKEEGAERGPDECYAVGQSDAGRGRGLAAADWGAGEGEGERGGGVGVGLGRRAARVIVGGRRREARAAEREECVYGHGATEPHRWLIVLEAFVCL